MKNTNRKNKKEINYKITERVFNNENSSIEDILNGYLERKVEKLINSGYDNKEVRAISKENKEVA
ncbi:MAG: hypothetical protein JEZ08_00185 [Clostridiales bacterium]|nr:hypothetical protein [Clostridiales bacterium]